MTAYGSLLRQDRKDAGKTMGELARHLGVSISYVSDIELENRAPFDRSKIIQAADYLEADVLEHLKAAAAYRGAFELDAIHATKMGREVGAALARGWNDLSDDDMKAIADIIQKNGSR